MLKVGHCYTWDKPMNIYSDHDEDGTSRIYHQLPANAVCLILRYWHPTLSNMKEYEILYDGKRFILPDAVNNFYGFKEIC